MSIALANLFLPFALLIFFACIGWPVRRLIRNKMKDGWLKDLLLKQVGDKHPFDKEI